MSNDTGGLDYTEMFKTWNNVREYQDLNWSGTLNEYLNLVKKNPKITRNAFQRMYDMVMEKGTKEYVDVKKQMTHYNFFDDEDHQGKDCLLYTSPSPRDQRGSRMPSSA